MITMHVLNRGVATEQLGEGQKNPLRLQEICAGAVLKAVFTLPTVGRHFPEEEFLPSRYLSVIVSSVPDFAVKELSGKEDTFYFRERCMRSAVDLFDELVGIFARSVNKETFSQFNEAFKEKFKCDPPLEQAYESYDDARYLVQVYGVRSPEEYRLFCLKSLTFKKLPLLPEIIYSRLDCGDQWGNGGWTKFLLNRDLLSRWHQRSIDQLSDLKRRARDLFEEYSNQREINHLHEQWGLTFLKLTLRVGIMHYKYTTQRLIYRPCGLGLPQVVVDQLRDFKLSLKVFDNKTNDLDWDQFQIVVDQLRNLENRLRDLNIEIGSRE